MKLPSKPIQVLPVVLALSLTCALAGEHEHHEHESHDHENHDHQHENEHDEHEHEHEHEHSQDEKQPKHTHAGADCPICAHAGDATGSTKPRPASGTLINAPAQMNVPATVVGDFTIRRSEDRGLADLGWLESKHSFSFARYFDPNHLGFRSLKVINEDRVAPEGGFPEHPHENMEIFSYIVSGSLKHADTLGNARVIQAGELQHMSAGKGIRHSEFNPSKEDEVHFFQVWIEPAKQGIEPRYAEWLPKGHKDKRKVLMLSADGREGSAIIKQDAALWRLHIPAGESLTHELAEGRGLWLQVIEGEAKLNQLIQAQAGDGIATEKAGTLTIKAGDKDFKALLFDLK